MCIDGDLLKKADKCIETNRVDKLFDLEEENQVCTDEDRGPKLQWMRNGEALNKHMNEHIQSVYVPIYSIFPNLFTPYIRNMMQDNATVYNSIKSVVSYVKLLNNF